MASGAVGVTTGQSSDELSELREINRLLAETLTGLLGRMGQLEAGLTAVREDVQVGHRLLKSAYVSQRRDLGHALDLQASASSARFVLDNFPKAPRYADPHETLRQAARLVRVPGMVAEFGVASGTTLRILVEQLAGRPIYGFDVFTGLPEDWRTGYVAGAFAQAPPNVPGAELVIGLFEDTLPGFLAGHPGPVALLHLDADLYASTATVLDLLGDRLVEGTIVVFDEYLNYPGWEQHEHRAWQEFVARTGVQFEYAGYTGTHEQVSVRITRRPALG